MTEVFRVVGPPGCGKTWWLSNQVEQATGVDHRPIVLSLTRAAAKEAAGRATAIPPESIGTLHSFAYRSLGHPEIALTKKHIDDWNRRYPHFALTAVDDPDTMPTEIAKSIGMDFEICRANMIPPIKGSTVARFGELWTAWKRENELLDFTDLLERCLEEIPSAPGEPTVIFVDEAQDLSRLEVELLNKWGAAASRLVLVGDPWQNLYEWRGSHIDAMGDDPDIILSQSYRIPEAVHSRAISWMETMPGYRPIEYNPREVAGEVAELNTNWTEPASIINEVKDDLANGMDVMILAQSGYMLQPTVEVLRAEALMFHNPYRTTHGGWNPLGARRGVSATDRIKSFLKPTRFEEQTITDILAWTEAVYASAVLAPKVRYKDLSAMPTDDNGFVDHQVVSELLSKEAVDAFYWGDLGWLDSNLKKARESMRYPIAVARRHGASALDAVPQVVVGTIHSVKGGEADSVYVYPDLSRAAVQESQGESAISAAGLHRLGYVAMTRAREKLSIANPSNHRMAMSI